MGACCSADGAPVVEATLISPIPYADATTFTPAKKQSSTSDTTPISNFSESVKLTEKQFEADRKKICKQNLTATDEPEEISLEKKFNVFLSHKKNEAGLVARVFKSELQVLLAEKFIKHPQIFLDSDDLVDLRKLRNCVKQSENLILILTKTVLESAWCQVEIYTAIKYKIKIIPVTVNGSTEGFNFPEARIYVESINFDSFHPTHMSILQENEVEIRELKSSLRCVLDLIAKPFNSAGALKVQRAELNEIASLMSLTDLSVAVSEVSDPAVSWFDLKNKSLNISADSIMALNSTGTRPINLITIFGQARQGKSYLMNCISKKNKLFPVSASCKPCTKGVQLSKEFHTYSDFLGTSERDGPLIGYVDCEGQGDQGIAYDIALVTPLLLLSRVVIFNWLGRPATNEMLQKLAIMTGAAKKLADGQANQAFGALYIVLRDCDLPVSSELRDLLFQTEDPSTEPSELKREGMLERNTIRTDLLQSFKTIDIFCLPSPLKTNPERLADDNPINSNDDDFQQKLAEMEASLQQKLAVPHTFGSQELTGGTINKVMENICTLYEQNSSNLSPCSIMKSIVVNEAETSCNKQIQAFECALKQMKADATKFNEKTIGGKTFLLPFNEANIEDEVVRHKSTLFKEVQSILSPYKEGFPEPMQHCLGKCEEALELVQQAWLEDNRKSIAAFEKLEIEEARAQEEKEQAREQLRREQEEKEQARERLRREQEEKEQALERLRREQEEKEQARERLRREQEEKEQARERLRREQEEKEQARERLRREQEEKEQARERLRREQEEKEQARERLRRAQEEKEQAQERLRREQAQERLRRQEEQEQPARYCTRRGGGPCNCTVPKDFRGSPTRRWNGNIHGRKRNDGLPDMRCEENYK